MNKERDYVKTSLGHGLNDLSTSISKQIKQDKYKQLRFKFYIIQRHLFDWRMKGIMLKKKFVIDVRMLLINKSNMKAE